MASDALNGAAMGYVLITPFFIIYVLYKKWRMVRAVITIRNPKKIQEIEMTTGISLLLMGFVVYWSGMYSHYAVEYHILTVPMLLSGAVLLFYNWQTLRQLLFPILLLLFLNPILLWISNIVTLPMAVLGSSAVYRLLGAIGLPAILKIDTMPSITTTTAQGVKFQIVMDATQSGLYLLIWAIALVAFVGFITKGPMWKRLAFCIIGFPVAYGLNVLRVASAVWIAYGWGEAMAMQFLNLLGGPSLILITMPLLLIMGKTMGKLEIFTSRAPKAPCRYCDISLAEGRGYCTYCGAFQKSLKESVTGLDLLKIGGVLALVALIFTIQISPYMGDMGTAGIDLSDVSPEGVKGVLYPTIPGWEITFSYRDAKLEQVAKWDLALVYNCRRQGTDLNRSGLYLMTQVGQQQNYWEATLSTKTLEARDIDILDNPRITGRFLYLVRVNSTDPEVILYWFERTHFTSNDWLVSRYVCIGIDAHPAELAKEGLIDDADYEGDVKDLLLSMSRVIAEHWESLKTSTYLYVGFGRWVGYVLILIASLCISIIAFLNMKLRMERKRNSLLFDRLSREDREVLDAVAQSSGKGLPITKEIEARYHEITGKEVDHAAFVETLEEAMRRGFIDSKIYSDEDEPVLIWKNRFMEEKEFIDMEREV